VTRLLPVVMMTSSGDQDKVDTIDAGADDFIARPFNPSELVGGQGSHKPNPGGSDVPPAVTDVE
jgi:CheY-like chemotaxis protein